MYVTTLVTESFHPIKYLGRTSLLGLLPVDPCLGFDDFAPLPRELRGWWVRFWRHPICICTRISCRVLLLIWAQWLSNTFVNLEVFFFLNTPPNSTRTIHRNGFLETALQASVLVMTRSISQVPALLPEIRATATTMKSAVFTWTRRSSSLLSAVFLESPLWGFRRGLEHQYLLSISNLGSKNSSVWTFHSLLGLSLCKWACLADIILIMRWKLLHGVPGKWWKFLLLLSRLT
jgi:hypothetical protein